MRLTVARTRWSVLRDYDVVDRRHRQLPDALSRERRLRAARQADRVRRDPALRGPGLGLRRAARPLLPLPVPEPPPPGSAPSCAEAGVLGVLPGLVAMIQATEALKLLTGIGEPLIGRFVQLRRARDALRASSASARIPTAPPAARSRPLTAAGRLRRASAAFPPRRRAPLPSSRRTRCGAAARPAGTSCCSTCASPRRSRRRAIEGALLLPLGELTARARASSRRGASGRWWCTATAARAARAPAAAARARLPRRRQPVGRHRGVVAHRRPRRCPATRRLRWPSPRSRPIR